MVTWCRSECCYTVRPWLVAPVYVIMQEKLERVSTPLFGGLVRCSAHGRSFTRLQYYFPKAIKLQNCVATIQRCQPFKDVQLQLCDYCTILLVYTRLGHKTTIMRKITYNIRVCFLISQVVALHLLLLLLHRHLPHQHSKHWLVIINNYKTLSAEYGSVVNYHFLWIIWSIVHRTSVS